MEDFIPLVFAAYTDGQGSKHSRKHWETKIIKAFFTEIDKVGCFMMACEFVELRT